MFYLINESRFLQNFSTLACDGLPYASFTKCLLLDFLPSLGCPVNTDFWIYLWSVSSGIYVA